MLYLHTHRLLAYPTLKISGTLFSVVSLFEAITTHKFNSIYVVHMCQQSHGM